jgi:hypothetical protein
MQQKLMAFWKYPNFPYCLSGEVGEMKDDLVYIKSYQSWFKPFLLTEYNYGLELKNKLEILEDEKRVELKKIDIKYQSKLQNILGIDLS